MAHPGRCMRSGRTRGAACARWALHALAAHGRCMRSRHPGRCMRLRRTRRCMRSRRTRLGAACARGAPHALAAHPAGRCMRSRHPGRCMRSRRTRGAACARFIRTVRLLPHGAVAIVRTAASARCYHNRRGTLRTCAGDNGGSFPSCASTARCGRRAAPPVGRPHAIDPGRCRLAANLIQTSPSSVHTDTGLFVEFFLQTTSTCKNHNMQHVQSTRTCKNITSNMYSTVCMLTCKKVDVAPSERSEGDGKGSPLCRLHICV
jgi:hypothetical protein